VLVEVVALDKAEIGESALAIREVSLQVGQIFFELFRNDFARIGRVDKTVMHFVRVVKTQAADRERALGNLEAVLRGFCGEVLAKIMIEIDALSLVADDDRRTLGVKEKRQTVFDEAMTDHSKCAGAVLLVRKFHIEETHSGAGRSLLGLLRGARQLIPFEAEVKHRLHIPAIGGVMTFDFCSIKRLQPDKTAQPLAAAADLVLRVSEVKKESTLSSLKPMPLSVTEKLFTSVSASMPGREGSRVATISMLGFLFRSPASSIA
jgi:hypothetical protein